MDTDKAYLLGLIIGGGVFGNAEDVFRIKLPYNKWGSYLENPERAGEIAKFILNKVGQMFRAVYNLTVQYETSQSGSWTILCEGDTSSVKDDLLSYNIECEGELRGNADISGVVAKLVDDNLKRRFIAGLADTIGSMVETHRRFDAEHQIISFEISGCNYNSVCDLCRLLYSVNCIPDQITWNHPNIHCTNNPYYKQWNKGFKIRVLLDQYANFGAFSLPAKAQALNKNRSLQKTTHSAIKCEQAEIITKIKPKSVHPAENDIDLPTIIRNGHYIHSKHFCAVLGCEHAPYDKICSCFSRLGEYVIPFPILWKGSSAKVDTIIKADPLLYQRKYMKHNLRVLSLLSVFKKNRKDLLFGTSDSNGYPLNYVLQAAAYIFSNDTELGGNRHKGSYFNLLKSLCQNNANLDIEVYAPDLLTPLVIVGNGRAALVGAKNPKVYAKLVSFDPNNKYKLLVRQITEEDLQGDQ